MANTIPLRTIMALHSKKKFY
ncbi:hypothetical protein MNBD_GAMMA20-2115, partial [hydrothermal vent metagenome]